MRRAEQLRGVSVSQATPADAAEIAAVHVASWRAAYRDLMPASYLEAMSQPEEAARWARSLSMEQLRPRRTLVAQQDGGPVIGYATVGEDPEEPGKGLLFLMYVAPDWWGRGVGDALMDASEHTLAALGFEHANLWVLEANQRARKFYERRGWRPGGAERTSSYGDAVLNALRYCHTIEKPARDIAY